ncbi:MAG: GNAT family N-acetyltransferase [Muribaculaceae bacterium]|jgi:hypothetical protein|nr:GNAT family N-acetyltransferase [Muribaculaceae bacterium]
MDQIIDPVSTEEIESELTPDRLLRKTNKAGNEIYVVDAHTSPAVMREIGRLREIAFRHGGGGTGKSCDIDEFDLMERPCHQLIVWDPDSKMILGGYRYLSGREMKMDSKGKPCIAMSHLFDYSQDFVESYLPETIELGRSFVRLGYQSSQAGSKAMYVLDNLWDGLGALTVDDHNIKYLLGKMTMYPSYDVECRNMLLYFLEKHFPDTEGLVWPIEPLEANIDHHRYAEILTADTFKDDYKILNGEIRARGINIPPLVNAYMSLSPTMKMLGTAINHEFGEVEETGIFFAIDDIFEEKKRRHIESYTAVR